MTTCKDCLYNELMPDGQKELKRFCVRFPPTSHALGTSQGVMMLTAYPNIQDTSTACGEWDDGADITIESADRLN